VAGDQPDGYEDARRIALRRLATRARSTGEVGEYLRREQVPEPAIQAVIDRFTAVGLLDDAAFARSWVEERQRAKSAGASQLRRELVAKGIDEAIIGEVLAGGTRPDDEVALDLARRRIRAMSGLDKATQTRRLAGQLARRGFAPSVVRRVVARVVGESSGDGSIGDHE